MKILYLNLFDDPAEGGGAETTLWNLMKGVQARGHEAVVLSIGHAPGLHAAEIGRAHV